ncbi:transposase [Desmospora sp. 8437]|nr:transposase [Desmospora sp. 8437]
MENQRQIALWKCTGASWHDLLGHYGLRKTWTWDHLLKHVQTKSDAVSEIEWIISVDSSVVRAH